jgi:hypothetical protein
VHGVIAAISLTTGIRFESWGQVVLSEKLAMKTAETKEV